MSDLTDMLGSTIALANSSGALTTQYSYEPFGATTIAGSSTNPFQFTGRENDGTGLYYYRARYYSPTFGRFISQDPLGFGGGDPNLYGYVAQDPANFVDPLGLSAYYFRIFAVVGFGVEVGTNPDGTPFTTFDVGFGGEFGYGWDPCATQPGYEKNGPSLHSDGVFSRWVGKVLAAEVGLTSESGVDYTQNGSRVYSHSGPIWGISGPLGIDIGGSAGLRVSWP